MPDQIINGMLVEEAFGSIYSNQYSDAAKAARANEVARKVGIAPELVEAAFPDIMADARVQKAAEEARRNQAYARMMANRRLAASAIDDDQLPKVAARTDEHIVRTRELGIAGGLLQYPKEVIKGFGRASAGFYSLARTAVDVIDQAIPDKITISGRNRGLKAVSRWLQSSASDLATRSAPIRTDSRILNDVYAGAQSVGPSTAAMIAMFLTRNSKAAAAVMGAMTAGEAAEEGRQAGMTPIEQLSYGAQQAVPEAGFELLSARVLKESIDKALPFARVLGRQILAEIATEIPTTLSQSTIRYANIGAPKEGQSIGEWMSELPDEVLSTVIATASSVAFMTGGSYVAGRTINRYVEGRADQNNARRVDRIMEAAAQSSTRQSNPTDFAEALNQLVGDSDAETLYVPADKVQELFQDDRNLRDDPFWSQYAEQIEEASSLGGDVVIPLATAATHLAGSGDWNSLREHVRTRPGGASLSEVKQSPEELEKVAGEIANILDRQLPQLRGQQLTKQFAETLGYEGEQAEAITRLLAAAMVRAHAIENAKRQARGEEPIALEEFAPAYLPEAARMTQAEYDAGQQPFADAAQTSDAPLSRDEIEAARPPDNNRSPLWLAASMVVDAREGGRKPMPIWAARDKESGEIVTWTTKRRNPESELYRNTYPEDVEIEQLAPEEVEAEFRQRSRGGTLSDTFRRGNISIKRGDDTLMSGAIIRAFEAANFSTAVHELGHFFLEDLRRRALRGDATEQEIADWQTFKDWALNDLDGLLVADDQIVPTEAHEFWARGFERYIYEGNAPSSALRSVFARMRDFMLALYRSIRSFNAPITPEIREVMDRLLASDEEIAARREEMRLGDEALSELMTAEEQLAYAALGTDARETAREKLFESVLSTLRAEKTREARERKREIKADVEAEVDAQPTFTALRLLRSGIPQNDGTTARASLSREWLIDNYGEDIVERLPKGVPPIVNDQYAFDAETLAGMAGFESGDAMVKALEDYETNRQRMRDEGDKRSPRQALIEDTTDARYRDEVGDPFEDLEEEAEAALANERQADRLSMELRALSRKAGGRPTAWQAANEWARRHVRSQSAKEAISGRAMQMYARNASKAAQRVEEALVKQDYNEAFTAKQQQVLNLALMAQAKHAKDETDKAVRRLQKVANRPTIASVDQDYLDQAHQLLETIDMKTRPATQVDKRLAFAAWHARQVELGVDPYVPPEYRETLAQTNWSRMSIDELLELDRTVSQVIELGRLKQRLIDGKKERDFNEAVAEMQDVGGAQPPRMTGKTTDPSRSLPGRARSVLRSVDAAMIKTETITKWMDGGDPNGPWTRVIFRPMSEAQGREKDLLRVYVNDINDLIKGLSRPVVRTWERIVDTPELVINNPNHLEHGQPFRGTKDQIVMMAMNWGNEGNRQRLADGFGWDPAAIEAVFDRVLTKADWDFVQSVWDTVDKLWPELAALERRVNGVVPEKVEAAEVSTRHGVYRGGYFPVFYDPTQSTRAELDEADKLNPQGSWQMVTTRASSTRARAEAVKGRPLLLSMAVITRHMGEAIHDITHREAVSQVKRLLSDARVHSLISTRLGPEYAKAMGAWLENVARPNSAFSKDNPALVALGRHLNKGVSLVGLGFRVTTSFIQLLGLPVAGKVLGTKYLAQGMRIAAAHPVKTYNEITARSAEMRSRWQTLDAMIEDMVSEVANGKLRPIGPQGLAKYAFHGIAYMDMLVTTSVWTGAFNKALDENMSEDDAVHYADSVVRTTQGTGGMKDRSAIQNAHPIVRSLYPFFSYMNAHYNMLRDVGRQFRKAGDVEEYGEAARQLWWVAIVPFMLEALVFGEGPEDEEGDGLTAGDWANYFARSIALANLGSIPLIGNIANAVGNGYSYRSSAYQQIGEGLKRGWSEGADLLTGEGELTGSTVKSVLTTIGVIAAKPLGQIGATSQGLYDYATGEAEPEDAGDWYELLTKGRISQEPTAAERLLGETET